MSALEDEIIAKIRLLDKDAQRRVIAQIRSELDVSDSQMSVADMINEMRDERDNQIIEAVWGPRSEP